MEKIKRNERMAVITQVLTGSPNRIFTLSYFCDLFQTAKSTISEDIALLEKWCGIPGPAAPWLLTALAADLVSLRKQPLLALFSSEQEHFISTITPGSEDEYTG